MTQQRIHPHTDEDLAAQRDRAVLVGVDRGDTDWPIEESLAELARLADTAEVDVVATCTSASTGRTHARSSARARPTRSPRLAKELVGEPRHLRRRALAESAAQHREAAARHARHRPHGAHPRDLRDARGHARGQAAGRPRAAGVRAAATARHVGPPREGASRRRARIALRRRRVAARDRPPHGAQAHRRAQARAARRCQASASSSASRARAAASSACRSSATPTPASRRCSTR